MEEAGTSEVVTTDNPQAESAVTTNETSNQDGEATQGATGQDSFIPKDVDVNTLPPNLRAIVDKINKDMVRGFTEKTSSISEKVKQETAKAVAQYQEKAKLYEQIAAQEDFVQKWNAYVQEKQSGGQTAEGDPKLSQLEAKFEEINQKIQMSELSQMTNAFAEAVNEKGVKLHPEFDELNTLPVGQGPNGEQFSLLSVCSKLAQGQTPQERLANGYKQAKLAYSTIFEAGKKAGMGRVQAKIQNGTQPPSNSTGDILSYTEKRPKNAREAIEMARRGQVVSRD